jgi:hypothetical protein
MASGAWEHRGRQGLESRPPSRTKASKIVSTKASKIVSNEHRVEGGGAKSKKNK